MHLSILSYRACFKFHVYKHKEIHTRIYVYVYVYTYIYTYLYTHIPQHVHRIVHLSIPRPISSFQYPISLVSYLLLIFHPISSL